MVSEICRAVGANRRLVIGGLVWIGVMQLLASTNLSEWGLFRRAFSYGYRLVAPVYYAGDAHECNLCGRKLRAFRLAQGTTEWACPFCFSRPRHRTTWMYLNKKTDLFDGRPRSLLHVAPEPSIEGHLRNAKYIDYLSGDLEPGAAMVEMDITDIHYPDDAFDVIYCSHVLEHVPDDGKAMSELYRVLKPGGWAILAVPIRGETTVEDPTVTDPVERQRLFGQHDHVRYYGKDFKDRLQAAGFRVRVDDYASQLPKKLVEYHSLSRGDIYFCEKRLPEPPMDRLLAQ